MGPQRGQRLTNDIDERPHTQADPEPLDIYAADGAGVPRIRTSVRQMKLRKDRAGPLDFACLVQPVSISDLFFFVTG